MWCLYSYAQCLDSCLDSYADVRGAATRMPSASTRILGSYLICASPMNSRMPMYLLPLSSVDSYADA